jgi:F-type H+/Na+-transporting ATPase subunit alpha
MRVLDKGSKNVEILKQGQYSPMKIEHQVAIIYCGTKELLRQVPIEKVKEFEVDFLETMEMSHRAALDEIKEGKMTQEIEDTIRKVAAETAEKYKK